jgi:nitrate reductase NapAB chaperone NapD
MPIKSYLAYPVRGGQDDLAAALRALGACEVVAATNREVLVVVTDTTDEAAEEALQRALLLVPGLEALALVAGVDDAAAEPARPQEAHYDPS